MASVATGFVAEEGKTFILDRIKEWYSVIISYEDNINQLEEKYDKLRNLRDYITNKVELEEKNMHKKSNSTDTWLNKVERLMKEDKELQELMEEEIRKGKDQYCFGHLQCNWYERYKMSQLAIKKAKEIQDRIDDKPEQSMITEALPLSDIRPIPTEFLDKLQSREQLIKEILEKLRDDRINAVGVFGMGAIGKTALVKEIANKRAKDMFDQIVMVEISEAPNVERIQNDMAEQIGLRLAEVKSLEERAKKLNHSLKDVKPKAGQHGDDKRTKILIILDNIWGKLDLGKVGIPRSHENTKEFCCKLLVTSREKNVCQVMGVSAETTSMVEVQVLNEEEARQLFRAKIGKTFYSGNGNGNGGRDQEEVEKRLLKKCGGLPLAIVALADVLRGQDLPMWEHYATQLEKPTPNQGPISGIYGQAYSILETSYKLIESEEKKRFLLLACLFPLGSSITVKDMLRYGIGLGLFQHVNNLTEAMELANDWVHQLKSSALLLNDRDLGRQSRISLAEDDRNGKHVKIHDIVRESIISLAQKGGDMFMVEALPKWLFEETCQMYNAISVTSSSNLSILDGLHTDKLQILIVDGSEPGDQIPDTFFGGMSNLKVLVLKNMDFSKGLPNSIGKLKKSLRTLHLEDCELGDIGRGIEKLTNLIVLSLRGSKMGAEFPAEAMRNLGKIRLLDLTECELKSKGIPADVLSKFPNLEGLYLFNSIEKWANNNEQSLQEDDGAAEGRNSSETNNEEYASIKELNKQECSNNSEQESGGREGSSSRSCETEKDKEQESGGREGNSGGETEKGNEQESGGREGISGGETEKDNEQESSSEKDDEYSYASINELNKLSNLKVVELEVANLQQLPVNEEGEEFVRNLDRFFISINTTEFVVDQFSITYMSNSTVVVKQVEFLVDHFSNNDLSKYLSPCSRTLVVQEVDVRSMVEKYNCVKALLKKSERLYLDTCKGLEHLGLEQGVKDLFIISCYDCVECFAWTFLNLETLMLYELPNLKRIYPLVPSQQATFLTFLRSQLRSQQATFLTSLRSQQATFLTSLRSLVLIDLPELQPCALPIHLLPPKLSFLMVRNSQKLKFIFGEEENANLETNVPHLSRCYLNTIILENVTELEGMLMLDHLQPSLPFFNPTLLLPSLQRVCLNWLGKIETLWDAHCKETCYISSFCKLTDIAIEYCDKLKSLGPLSIAAALEQLKSLSIMSCPEIAQVITNDQELASTTKSNMVVKPFPSLETLQLYNCPNLQSFLSSGSQASLLEFPSLQSLEIDRCSKLHSFSPGTFKAPNLNQAELDCRTYFMQEHDRDINGVLKTHYENCQKQSEESQGMSSGGGDKGEIQLEEVAT